VDADHDACSASPAFTQVLLDALDTLGRHALATG